MSKKTLKFDFDDLKDMLLEDYRWTFVAVEDLRKQLEKREKSEKANN